MTRNTRNPFNSRRNETRATDRDRDARRRMVRRAKASWLND